MSAIRPKTFEEALKERREKLKDSTPSHKKKQPFGHIPDVENMDWTAIWDTASTYNPFLIPLPVRCGRAHEKKAGVSPAAAGNVELMKIPNFFHLTPIAIEKHCKALKPFIKPWPEHVKRSVRITTINYIYAGPSIRHPDSRFVKLQVNLADLNLDARAKRKFALLVGDRYNRETDEFTLVTGQCPTRAQNRDYAYYLLDTLYHESLKEEPWEEEAKNYTEEYIDAEVEKVRKEIDPLRHKKKILSQTKKKSFIFHHRVIKNNVIRFNDQGHPFALRPRDGKSQRRRLLSKKRQEEAAEVWKRVKKDDPTDNSTFDAAYKSSYASEFKYS